MEFIKKSVLMLVVTATITGNGANLHWPVQEVRAEESSQTQEVGTIQIEGLAYHYHTGDEVQLVATTSNDIEGNWQWFIRNDADSQWQAVDGLTTQIFSREATQNGQQIKVALLENNGTVIQESEPSEVVIDDHHNGVDNESSQRIYNGFFYNDEIQDRTLADWEGDWQSVYPYLESGELDGVFQEKAEASDTMTQEDYKDYYTVGYETDVNRIVIKDDQFTFYSTDGGEESATYEYDGYEILNYERGNRGVRFVFKRASDNEAMPTYIQFSDHSINPTDALHYHLYWRDDRQALLDEVDHWPTYYPSDWGTEEIVHDMLAH